MKLKAEETDLVGHWTFTGDQVQKDEISLRIEGLINNYLERIGQDASGWNVLFRDPYDGRLWELTYPNSELHGGGPPRLTVLTKEEALTKYKQVVLLQQMDDR